MFPLIALPVVGFLIGLFIITLGGGGGAMYVGILTVVFHIPAEIAASTSLATMIPTTAMGAFSHWRAGNTNIRIGFYLLGGGVLGSVFGSVCFGVLPQSAYDKIAGMVIVGISIQMLVQFLWRSHVTPGAFTNPRTPWRFVQAEAYGVFGGILSGLIGISGSSAIVGGLSVLGCEVREISGTSVLVLLGVAITGFLMHLHLGTIDWPLLGLFLPGTLVGAFFGPVMLQWLPPAGREKVLRPVFVVLMIGTGLALALK